MSAMRARGSREERQFAWTLLCHVADERAQAHGSSSATLGLVVPESARPVAHDCRRLRLQTYSGIASVCVFLRP